MDLKDVQIVYKDITELIEPDYNPRKINAKQREDIKKSLTKYGFVQPLVVNIHADRMNIIVGGNQRKKIAEAMGYEKAPCILVELNEEDEKELNLRLNKNTAEFDFTLLNDFFDKDFLFGVGFSEKEIGKIESEFDAKFKEVTNDNAEMAIVQEYNEKYRVVMIFSNNEMDFNWMRNVLNLERKKDYSNSKIGESLVITVQEFQKIWEQATNQEEL